MLDETLAQYDLASGTGGCSVRSAGRQAAPSLGADLARFADLSGARDDGTTWAAAKARSRRAPCRNNEITACSSS